MKHLNSILSKIITLSFFALPYAAQADTLTIEQFLSQVQSGNSGFQGAQTTGQAGLQRSVEGDLLTTPQFFANVNLSADSKLQEAPFGNYDRFVSNDYQIGFSDTTNFGLTASLYYDATYIDIQNINYGTFAPPFTIQQYDGKPVLTLTQDLWGNGFGKSTVAQKELIESQALSSGYNSRYQTKVILANAELNYWQLSIARQLVAIQLEAEDRAQKIYDYSARRARVHLADEADELQALAALDTRKLSVQAARDDERVSSRAFNTARNISSDEVPETLVQGTHPIAETLTVPKRALLRDDVKAAQENARATRANGIVQSEKDLPVLQVFGSFAVDGRANDLGPTFTNSFASGRNTVSGGLKLTVPLSYGTISASRAGWAKEEAGAEMTYQKSLFDQEQTWQDLNLRFAEAKRRLEMARVIEKAQEKKLEYEKDRLKKGRTTTYQVLLFEQDYVLSEATRLQAEGDVFNVFTQMKLFKE
jgi:outer membrane protein TolC